LYGLDKSFKPFTYFNNLLPIFAAAIVGGIGNPLGAFLGGYVIAFSEIIITYAYKKFFVYLLPESLEPKGLPIPPTIAAAKIGRRLLKYVKGLKLLSKPYKVPAMVAKIAAIIQVIITTLSGLIPDNKARSSLSEYALMLFPVLVLLKNQNNIKATMIVVNKVKTCVDLIAKPSFNPVISLNSLSFIINFSPSKNLLSKVPIIILTTALITNMTPMLTIARVTGVLFLIL
jgi:hypothetical protein